MTVIPRAPSRKGKGKRSSFVPSGQKLSVVPDALSWRERLHDTTAPKGPAAWAAASNTQQGRTIIDAGPYGLIDLADVDVAADLSGRDPSLGVVWWDRRSYREEDDDLSTIQTSFVPASISDHVSLAGPGSRPAMTLMATPERLRNPSALGNSGASGNPGTRGNLGAAGNHGTLGNPWGVGKPGVPGKPGAIGTAGVWGNPGAAGNLGATASPGPGGAVAPAKRTTPSFSDMVFGVGDEHLPRRVAPAHAPTMLTSETRRTTKGKASRTSTHIQARPTSPSQAAFVAPPGRPAVPVPASRPEQVEQTPRRSHAAAVPARRSRAEAPRQADPARNGPAAEGRSYAAGRTRRRVILGAVLLVFAFVTTFLIQTALVTPFTVPSASMENTLHVGDRIVVNRAAYSFGSIHRGDVVVFSDPGGWLSDKDRTGAGDYIVKRVIGLPGDHVSCCGGNGKVKVNGIEVAEPHANTADGFEAASAFDVTVPSGALWVLGDNRHNSRDSSQTQDLPSKGFVPIGNVVGQAVLTVWPLAAVSAIGSAHDAFAAVPDPTCPI